MGIPTNSLTHSGKIKDSVIERLLKDEFIQKLTKPQTGDTSTAENEQVLHCFDTSFHPGTVPVQQGICLFVEAEVANVRKSTLEHKLTISIYASPEYVKLTENEKALYKSQYNFAGNRIDMIIAAIFQNLCYDKDFSYSLGTGQLNLSEDKDPVTAKWSENGWYGKSIVYSIYR